MFLLFKVFQKAFLLNSILKNTYIFIVFVDPLYVLFYIIIRFGNKLNKYSYTYMNTNVINKIYFTSYFILYIYLVIRIKYYHMFVRIIL